jgi:hypothetical protein
VAVNIEELPLSLKEFKNYHMYKSKEIGVEDLILRLKLEKENKLFKRGANSSSIGSKAKFVVKGKNIAKHV